MHHSKKCLQDGLVSWSQVQHPYHMHLALVSGDLRCSLHGVRRLYHLSSCPSDVLVTFLQGGGFYHERFKGDLRITKSYSHRDAPYIANSIVCMFHHGQLHHYCSRVDLRERGEIIINYILSKYLVPRRPRKISHIFSLTAVQNYRDRHTPHNLVRPWPAVAHTTYTVL